MSFVRFPAKTDTAEGVLALLLELDDVMRSDEYAEMREMSKKKTEEVAELKWNRDQARKLFRNGRSDWQKDIDSELAEEYRAGNLEEKVRETEEAYGRRKQEGIAVLLNL